MATSTRDTDSAYVYLEAKTDYKLCVDSSSESNATQTLFIRIVEDSNSTNLLSTAYSRDVASNTQKLINSKDCSGCNLNGSDLDFADLGEADLAYAGLMEAHLTSADLRDARLTHDDLSYANLFLAFWTYADLSRAILDGATWLDGRICKDGSISYCK